MDDGLETRYTALIQKIKLASLNAGQKQLPVLVAVSKFQSFEKVHALYQLGHRDFGENYVQELIQKAEQFLELGIKDVRFHFIGRLQRNKVKALLPYVSVIHSVDSARLYLELCAQVEKTNALAVKQVQEYEIYFQVNAENEETKGGFSLDELEQFCKTVEPKQYLTTKGLMCIPEAHKNPETVFKLMGELSKKYGPILGYGLSMGMSDDFEVAIQCGSTIVRVGSALFGPRES